MVDRWDVLFHRSRHLSSIPAEAESDSEEEASAESESKQIRDSGCFESSENLATLHEEPRTETKVLHEETEEETEQEEQTEKLDEVQQELEDLTVQ